MPPGASCQRPRAAGAHARPFIRLSVAHSARNITTRASQVRGVVAAVGISVGLAVRLLGSDGFMSNHARLDSIL